ncbi:DUF421 domain-containing protein [Caldimonas tepidiphila]|uniref:DUF421 domain-containing protein n=1 Tax=Caldimonas tepidiphila TaxID=2315841 RepID=UPI000E5B2183|nr:YetF domain-containing protein [Caldimonas tepidiphila]
MFFDGWMALARIVILGTLAYVALVLLLRVTGKRTLSKLNAFDLIVTVALGSTLATVLLSKDVSLSEGVTALALLIGLQWILTWLSVRSRRVSDWVKAEPSLLYHEGRFLRDAMRRERVTEDELRAAVRMHGFGRMEQAVAVILETDGSLDVIGPPGDRPWTALANVQGSEARALREAPPGDEGP